MVDIHHHLLPGLDDGSPDLATSVRMARLAAEDGITHVVCTPHASHTFSFQPQVILNKLSALRSALKAESIPLQLVSGCDFHLSYENIQDALADTHKYTIAGKNYLLVELPDYGISPNLGQTLYQLQVAGMIPILTHPERNATLQKDIGRLADWIRAGLLIQVTTSSVVGEMGKTAQRIVEQLLEKRWVHFLATDAHNTTRRPPRMSEARASVERRHGAAYAELLSQHNPLAAVEGRPLPEQLAVQGVFEGGISKPSFWSRLFGRA